MMIAVEGCIGVGKTTVAKQLAAFRRTGVLLEMFEQNPFLQAFYQTPEIASVETEFCFLLLHYHQVKMQFLGSESEGDIVADFCLSKDLLYSDLNLRNSPYQGIFEQLYSKLAAEIPKPDLMVCLSAPDDLILDRISQRNRTLEHEMNAAYFKRLNGAYQSYFERMSCKRIVLDMAVWDFVQEPTLAGRLSEMVDAELGRL